MQSWTREFASASRTTDTGQRLTVSGRLSRRIKSIRRDPLLTSGILIVVLVCIVAVFAPRLATHDPLEQSLRDRLLPPIWDASGSQEHLLGTDGFGRDLFSRILFGARISLLVGPVAVILSGTLGVMVGVIAGYFGGRLETISMLVIDAQTAFPTVLVAIIVISALGPGLVNLIIVIALTSWMTYARVVYGIILSIKHREFVIAARSIGARSSRIVFRHMLPNIWSPIIVISTILVGRAILLEAALSFLGLGVPPPAPTWGGMLAEARRLLFNAPWVATWPGLAILVTVLGINFVGEGLRRRTNR